MLMFILFSGVRPFGVSLLIAGWEADPKKPLLFQADPSVCIFFIIFLYLGL
jgi:20S proteasome alpha/beta subunit